jgi:alpha-N-arabinofuranosidase
MNCSTINAMKKVVFALLFVLVSQHVFAQQMHVLNVDVNKQQADISPNMWGVFFEDINLAADGGLYAELVKNRSFEFNIPIMGWKEAKPNGGSVLILNRATEKPANPRCARITVKADKVFMMTNEGFRGMGIKKSNSYNFSVWARSVNGTKALIKVELVTAKGAKIGEGSVQINGKDWKQYKLIFSATETELKAKMNFIIEGAGLYDVDMISLFPADTWKGRANGLRKDLVQWLADMKPGFIRFPGGCIVEGRDLSNRYQWKKTVGKVEDRQLIINRWNTEFAHRSTPDYFQSFGLGFYEYFLLAEDIGAEPLPIINCGMACQFNTAEAVPIEGLQPYIQDALDLIEFANGSIQTKWGKLRADMGHPKPFNLKMIGAGNENWGEQYIDRLKIFTKAIKERYPKILLVNSSGTDPDGDRFSYLKDELIKSKADIIDEHYYKPPSWFLANASRYDKYNKIGFKVFAGEYAAHTKLTNVGEKKNNWEAALAEAAFMTGLERNADVVNLASYAPLFAHIDGWQWAPDLIWFDNLNSYGTPSYYVQKMFSTNKGTQVVSIAMNDSLLVGNDSLYASACIDKTSNELIVKLVNTLGKEQSIQLVLNKNSTVAQVETLKSISLTDVNSFETASNISPVKSTIPVINNKVSFVAAPYSFMVFRIKL